MLTYSQSRQTSHYAETELRTFQNARILLKLLNFIKYGSVNIMIRTSRRYLRHEILIIIIIYSVETNLAKEQVLRGDIANECVC